MQMPALVSAISVRGNYRLAGGASARDLSATLVGGGGVGGGRDRVVDTRVRVTRWRREQRSAREREMGRTGGLGKTGWGWERDGAGWDGMVHDGRETGQETGRDGRRDGEG